MTLSTVAHETFEIERIYNVPVAQTFEAWADPTLKARWFAGSVEALGAGYELDFGSEAVRSIGVGLRAGPSIPSSQSSETSFLSSGSSIRTRCTPMRRGFLCPSPLSSSVVKEQRRNWS
jgi:hypothetical protein